MVADLLARGLNNTALQRSTVDAFLMEAFSSIELKKLFASRFDEEIWNYALKALKTANYYPMREPYSILALVRVIEDLIAGSRVLQASPFEEFGRIISESEGNVNPETKEQSIA